MKIVLGVCAAAVLACAVWVFWPAKPPHDCGNLLEAPSVGDCDTTGRTSR